MKTKLTQQQQRAKRVFFEMLNEYHASLGVYNRVELHFPVKDNIFVFQDDWYALWVAAEYIQSYVNHLANDFRMSINEILTSDALVMTNGKPANNFTNTVLSGNYIVTAYLLGTKAVSILGADNLAPDKMPAAIAAAFSVNPRASELIGIQLQVNRALQDFISLAPVWNLFPTDIKAVTAPKD